MSKRVFWGILLLVPALNAPAAGDGDWQIWFGGSATGTLADSVKATVEETAYYSNDDGEVYEQYTQPSLSWAALDWLALGGGCRFVFSKSASGWLQEDRPYLELTLKTAWEGWKVKNRSRVAYRSRESGDDLWRFRNKTTVTLPWTLSSWKLGFYLAEEFFFEQEQEGIYRNRAYAGLTLGRILGLETLGGDFYFMWDATEKDWGWQDTYVLGTMVRLAF